MKKKPTSRNSPVAKKQESKIISSNKRSYRWVLYIVFPTLFLLVYWSIFDPKVDLNGDNANYYILGKALSLGEGYVNINSIDKNPNNHFPPGYPVLISLIMTVLKDNLVTVKIFNGFFFLAGLFVLYAIFRRLGSSNTLAVVSLLFILFNSHLLRYSTIMMTEIPYILFISVTLYYFLKIEWNQQVFRQREIYISLLFLVASYYIRSTGIAFLGGIILFLLFNKKWKVAIFYFTGFLLMIVPWLIRSQQHGGSSYLRQLKMVNFYRPELGEAGFTDFVSRFFKNFARYLSREIPDGIFPFLDIDYQSPIGFTEWIIGLIVLTILIYGILNLKNYQWLLLAILFANFGILLLWPDVWVGVRFLLPLIPFLIFLFLLGLNAIFEILLKKIGFRKSFSLSYYLVFLLIFIPGIRELNLQAKSGYNKSWENYFQVANWLRQNRPAEVVVACRKPALFYLYSGTYTTGFKNTPNNQELIDGLKQNKVNYVVLDQLGYRQTYAYLLPAIQSNMNQFQTVFQIPNPDTYLLEFNP
jgi:hypothetical protein